MSLREVSGGKNAPDEINVIIEIPAHSDPVKYEVDKETGAIMVDRFMSTPMFYPCAYGYMPGTLSEDGDPLDVLIHTPCNVISGCVIRCRPVAILKMEDESGVDAKLLAVPITKLLPTYEKVKELEHIPSTLLNQIEHFFTHYKDLEEGKWVKVQGWGSSSEAKEEIRSSLTAYEEAESAGS
jgi:inorganic pyrophosphatase